MSFVTVDEFSASQKTLMIVIYVFDCFFFHLASFFIFRYQLPSSYFCTFVAAVSSVIDRFLSVSPSANLMFFETLNVLDRG